MNTILLAVGRVAGFAGAILCALAVVLRISGRYTIGDFQLGTLLVTGIAAMTRACFCLLRYVVNRADDRG
jgi:hypothetical protein